MIIYSHSLSRLENNWWLYVSLWSELLEFYFIDVAWSGAWSKIGLRQSALNGAWTESFEDWAYLVEQRKDIENQMTLNYTI